MLPRLGATYENKISIEITSKPKGDYLTDEYFALDLPVAPAICLALGLPEPEPPPKGLMGRLFK